MQYSIYFLASFLLSLIITPLVRQIAIKGGLVSYPRADRWHKKPTALLGGAGIYLASACTIAFLRHGATGPELGLFLGSTFLFAVGLIDDKFRIAPYTKLYMQIISGCIAIFFGTSIGWPENVLISLPLTLLWIVGVTNSFNLLDNIDGLCAGIAFIASMVMFFSSVLFSHNPLGVYALILSGSALGFLPYNFNPAKIFMGDSGSMLLGYSLAVVSISGPSKNITNLLTTMLIPVLILSVPIFDTMFVMIVRKLQGKKIFEGGKDHTSHRLVTLGLSQKKTVLLLYSVSIVFGLIAILYFKIDLLIISIIAFLATIVLLFFGFFLFESTLYQDKSRNQHKLLKPKNDKIILNGILMHKRRIIEVLLDFGLICAAYYAAYFLRFEGTLLSVNITLIKESLILIILIKMSVFFIFGLYRGVWRYVSISDLLTIFKAVTISSALSILFLTFVFRFKNYSRAVFFIDWLIMLFLIFGTRISFRVLGEFFSRIQHSGRNVLIYGAGDMGEAVVREIKRNKLLNYNPIGFIDDDASKLGNKIQGVTVLGARSKIKHILEDYKIEEVIIAIPSLDEESFSEICGILKESNIPYRRVSGILDSGYIDEFKQQ